MQGSSKVNILYDSKINELCGCTRSYTGNIKYRNKTSRHSWQSGLTKPSAWFHESKHRKKNSLKMLYQCKQLKLQTMFASIAFSLINAKCISMDSS